MHCRFENLVSTFVILTFDLSLRKWDVSCTRKGEYIHQNLSLYEIPMWIYQPELDGQTSSNAPHNRDSHMTNIMHTKI